MDLVSSTLDKYLKHRFNGTGLERDTMNGVTEAQNKPTTPSVPNPNSVKESNISTSLNEKQQIASIHKEKARPKGQETISITQQHAVTNGHSRSDNILPKTYKILISNIRPCCIAFRNDLHFIAAGFENSHIYLWNFKGDPQNILSVSDMFILLAHSGSIYDIVFVVNHDLMLSCSEDTTIRLWCLKSKCNVLVYRGHNYPIWSLDIGPQGNLFASGSMDATARLWRLDKITPVRIFCGHDKDVECIKFHPNEKYLATGSSDSTVRLWSIADGKMVRLMVGHQQPITGLSFFPDGKFLASASRGGVIKIWNLATNIVARELTVPPSFTISFSADQKFISSCGVDNVLRLWHVDGTNLVEKKKIDFQSQASNVIQSHFHRDNKLFVVHYREEEDSRD